MTIKIIFSRNKSNKIFSRLIQWYENTKYSHCCIEIVSYIKNVDIIFHSTFAGVGVVNKNHFLSQNDIIEEYQLDIDNKTFDTLQHDIFNSCGIKYAFLQNLGIVFCDYLRKIGLNIRNPWKCGYNCSELLYRTVIPLVCMDYKKMDPNKVTPSKIQEILRKNDFLPN